MKFTPGRTGEECHQSSAHCSAVVFGNPEAGIYGTIAVRKTAIIA